MIHHGDHAAYTDGRFRRVLAEIVVSCSHVTVTNTVGERLVPIPNATVRSAMSTRCQPSVETTALNYLNDLPNDGIRHIGTWSTLRSDAYRDAASSPFFLTYCKRMHHWGALSQTTDG
jgi:hypothetical protein